MTKTKTDEKDPTCLIAYFSRPGNNYVGGNIVNLPVGNTEVVAKLISGITGGDLFRIEPLQAYPADYTETTELAKEELRTGARPKLTSRPGSLASYDLVFLGYPNWWGTMPMPVFTFLEAYDLSKKTILPFCTHEGSGLGRSVSDIRKACPRATIRPGLAVRGGDVKNARNEVTAWLRESGIPEKGA